MYKYEVELINGSKCDVSSSFFLNEFEEHIIECSKVDRFMTNTDGKEIRCKYIVSFKLSR